MAIFDKLNSLVASFVAVSVFAISSEAQAGPPDDFTTSIPASACAPANSTDADKLALSNGSWVLTGTNVGPVTLVCPVQAPVYIWAPSINFVAEVLNWVYRSPLIGSMYLSYRDTDGNMNGTSGTNIRAVLKMRPAGGSAAEIVTITTLNSSNSTSTVDALIGDDFTTEDISWNHVFVEVTLKEDTSTDTAAFHGIFLYQ